VFAGVIQFSHLPIIHVVGVFLACEVQSIDRTLNYESYTRRIECRVCGVGGFLNTA